jgi:hypothetical protein
MAITINISRTNILLELCQVRQKKLWKLTCSTNNYVVWIFFILAAPMYWFIISLYGYENYMFADACTHLNITYAVEREIEMCFKMEAKFLKMQERWPP